MISTLWHLVSVYINVLISWPDDDPVGSKLLANNKRLQKSVLCVL